MKHILLLFSAFLLPSLNAEESKPNIVYILADDLGYGDVHSLNPERCKIATPRLDGIRLESNQLGNARE